MRLAECCRRKIFPDVLAFLWKLLSLEFAAVNQEKFVGHGTTATVLQDAMNLSDGRNSVAFPRASRSIAMAKAIAVGSWAGGLWYGLVGKR